MLHVGQKLLLVFVEKKTKVVKKIRQDIFIASIPRNWMELMGLFIFNNLKYM